MKRKREMKVEEPAGVYHAAKPSSKARVSPAVTASGADDPAFRQAVDKVFGERKGLLRKLAQ